MNVNITTELISQINTQPMMLPVAEDNYPIAPLVFAENTKDPNIFRVNIAVYVPADVQTAPSVVIENDGSATEITIENGKKVLVRSILVEYTSPMTPAPPQNYNLWGIYLEYSLNDVPSVGYLLTRLRNMDPKTSRGTVTTVQDPVRHSNAETDA